MTDYSLFWKKKTMISYVLAVLVFTIHLSTLDNYVPYVGAGIKEPLVWFVKVFSRVAVPAFFLISGALFFRNYNNSLFLVKLKSRFISLVIPYLAWNTIWMLFGWFTTLFFSQYFIGRPLSDISLMGGVKSFFFHGDNLPFWFIGNLILFILLTPLMYILIRNKYIGIVSILITLVTVYCLNLRYYAFLRTWFVDAESIVYYMVGAYVGMHFFSWFSGHSTAKTIFGAIIVLLCVFIRSCFDITTDDMFFRTLCLTVYAIGFFFAFDSIILRYNSNPGFLNHSFWVYALHLNLSAVITKLLFFFFPKTCFYAWGNLFATIISTLIFIELLNRLMHRYAPNLYSILSGAR